MVKNCIISEISRAASVATNPAAVPPTLAKTAKSTAGARFQINCTKLYVSVITFFINNNILEH